MKAGPTAAAVKDEATAGATDVAEDGATDAVTAGAAAGKRAARETASRGVSGLQPTESRVSRVRPKAAGAMANRAGNAVTGRAAIGRIAATEVPTSAAKIALEFLRKPVASGKVRGNAGTWIGRRPKVLPPMSSPASKVRPANSAPIAGLEVNAVNAAKAGANVASAATAAGTAANAARRVYHASRMRATMLKRTLWRVRPVRSASWPTWVRSRHPAPMRCWSPTPTRMPPDPVRTATTTGSAARATAMGVTVASAATVSHAMNPSQRQRPLSTRSAHRPVMTCKRSDPGIRRDS